MMVLWSVTHKTSLSLSLFLSCRSQQKSLPSVPPEQHLRSPWNLHWRDRLWWSDPLRSLSVSQSLNYNRILKYKEDHLLSLSPEHDRYSHHWLQALLTEHQSFFLLLSTLFWFSLCFLHRCKRSFRHRFKESVLCQSGCRSSGGEKTLSLNTHTHRGTHSHTYTVQCYLSRTVLHVLHCNTSHTHTDAQKHTQPQRTDPSELAWALRPAELLRRQTLLRHSPWWRRRSEDLEFHSNFSPSASQRCLSGTTELPLTCLCAVSLTLYVCCL